MIKVEHIQASITSNGDRIDTLVLEYPRCIHAQLLTHRVFSKNSSSSRAVPLQKAIDQIQKNPAEYIWTQNQAGMQGNVVTKASTLSQANICFMNARYAAIDEARNLLELGIHKQNAARLLEPFQNIKIVLTSTEWENWDWLRDDDAAQGEIRELARQIKIARENADVVHLNENEWHVPFVNRERMVSGKMRYFIPATKEDGPITCSLESAILISTSVCAQTSYRNADYSLEKAIDLKAKLFEGNKIHASPSEHQATPIPESKFDSGDFAAIMFNLPKGVTHIDRYGSCWSGNFQGFIQHRQLLKGHDAAKFIYE